MPRRKVTFTAGSYYHVYNRGAARLPIFREAENYRFLLQLLVDAAQRCSVTIVAYCLLPNHYHWLLRQDGETPISKVPHRVFGSYTQAYNKRYRRSGTLFESRYKAILVNSDDYLRQLCLYIHANPVRHGLVRAPESWPYSNYPDWIRPSAGATFHSAFVQQHFSTVEGYRSALASYLNSRMI